MLGPISGIAEESIDRQKDERAMSHKDTGYYLQGDLVFGPKGEMPYYFQGIYLYGPHGFTQVWRDESGLLNGSSGQLRCIITDGRFYGDSSELPWVPDGNG